MIEKANIDKEYEYLKKTYRFSQKVYWLDLSKRPKRKQAYYFIALMNNWPIKVLLDEGANKDNRTKAVLPEEKTISNLGEVKVTIQIKDIQAQIKVTIIKGEQPYLLLSEVDQARLHITKDRQNKIALINNKPISYQEMGSDTGYRHLLKSEKKHLDGAQHKSKNIKIFKELIPYSLKEQKILLKKQVEKNKQRTKLIGVTCNRNWADIVRTALATDSNLLQVFLEYKEPKGIYKNEQMKKYMMVQNGEPNIQEDDNIIQRNRKIGLKIILHTSMRLYLNDPL
ncbi:521_t:CDS:2 [Cetraspora pellucida]|uniref:521_t:CDS:1 n=1 Tax=Cetraspora pellucida TaxID=1433469 RepID=A0A9N9AXR1_9GLOM|nr:521_t:CDS:2 [Cetraspora pellucida]